MITHNDIFGWFNKEAEQFFSMIVDRFDSGSHFVEIGAYQGQSTCFIAQRIQASGKDIRYDVIDHFQGSPEHQQDLVDKNLYHIFLKNQKNADTLKTIHAYKLDANDAVNFLYDDNSLDFVYIDADHSYESVKNDISKWLPKVKKGGILSGDDYSKCHMGVIRAVDEAFSQKTIIGRNWWIEKC